VQNRISAEPLVYVAPDCGATKLQSRRSLGGPTALIRAGRDLAIVPGAPVRLAAIDEPVEATPTLTRNEPYSVRLASKYSSTASVPLFDERRQYSRRRDRDLEWIRSVRLTSGGDVALIDLSAGGALLDAANPLRPGSTMSLELIGRGLETVVSVHVLRAEVSRLTPDSMRFRGALQFASTLELPDLASIGEPTASGPEPFVGLDAALKRLVERAYSPDGSQRLATGDVLLVLQALSRRAASAPSDPFGQHIGSMLQDVLPALRHHHGLAAVLAAIERQLCLALPEARVRLSDAASTPAGSRSVLISPPGASTDAVPVSIHLPSSAVLNDMQARLLRTSSRLIALVQRVNPPAAPIPAADGNGPAAGRAWQKVVVRYSDGQLLKGFTHDFHASKSQFSLWPSTTAAAHERVVVPFARLKAVFFVREFSGNPDHVDRKVFDAPSHGRRIEVTLLDNEVIVGTTLNYRADSTGFFISPADPTGNNVRVFAVSSAVRQVRFP
jgi:hypothetical protein